ncbi:MAG: hypothetical protein KDK28_19145 [Maritimibacter sp.]|nr:hypothetical protein [Maritimibacter sp.]
MTKTDSTARFLENLNGVMECEGFRFDAETPLAMILKPRVVDPETFIGCIADALEIEEDAVPQDLIEPETDTVASVMARLAAAADQDDVDMW